MSHSRSRCSLLFLASLPLAACSSDAGSAPVGGGGGTAQNSFAVVSTNLSAAQPLRLNDALEVTFNQAYDPNTVTASAVRVELLGGFGPRPAGLAAGTGEVGPPVLGAFEAVSPTVLRFVPACPLGDPRDGLTAGRSYRLRLSGGNTPGVLSAGGRALVTSYSEAFTTAVGGPAALWDDPVAGPPQPVVRDIGSTNELATYLELGLDPMERVYFERDPSSGNVALAGGFILPLNRYSLIEDRCSWMVRFDQQVDPSADNLARIRLMYEDTPGSFAAMGAEITVEENCVDGGALVRVTPRGLLPQGTQARLRIDAGFRDLRGEGSPAAADAVPGFTLILTNPGTIQAGDGADGWLEHFLVGAQFDDSAEDPLGAPGRVRADWGDGELAASTGFSGTGGPGGDFDWFVPAGMVFIFDTTNQQVIGGPGGAPTTVNTAINGVLDLRDLVISAGAVVRAVGPNPLTILASGTVRIEGQLILDGGNSPGVGTLNTTNQPEPGASGNAGGGRGGRGSWRTTASTPHGEAGEGAFNVVGAGGLGGEASYSTLGKDARRGAGGGGGGFGSDVLYRFAGVLVQCQTLVGLDAEPGFAGGMLGLGAVSQSQRAMGGLVGPTPFSDGSDENDFFGQLLDASGTVIQGELAEPWAGSGGGGGGDAVSSNTFPLTPFNPTGDEKGAGAGGGGGQLRILAAGPIRIGPAGRVTSDGGDGGAGENTVFFDRVGGGSGGGSGGHIVLESMVGIEVQGTANSAGAFYTDPPAAAIHDPRSISAVGGQGGAGKENKGGANESGMTQWRCDAIPLDRVQPLGVPPYGASTCFDNLPNINDPLGPVNGAGGDGGPGLVQLNVPDPTLNLTFPNAVDVTAACAPPPVGWFDGAFQAYGVPSIGLGSSGVSRWIALGLARYDPSGTPDQVEVFLRGVDPQGFVQLATPTRVDRGVPLVAAAPIVGPPSVPAIGPDTHTITFSAGSVAGFEDVYERNPRLLMGGSVVLANPAGSQEAEFEIVGGQYDAALDRLIVHTSGAPLTSFGPPGVTAALYARTFRVATQGTLDQVSSGVSVRVRFDATVAGPDGLPDPTQAYSALQGDWAGDASVLNQAQWDFLRFRVDFELPMLDAPVPALGSLQLPFRF